MAFFFLLVICQCWVYLLGKTSKRDCGVFLGDLLYAFCICVTSFHRQGNAGRGFLESLWTLRGNLPCGSAILIMGDNVRILSGGKLHKRAVVCHKGSLQQHPKEETNLKEDPLISIGTASVPRAAFCASPWVVPSPISNL